MYFSAQQLHSFAERRSYHRSLVRRFLPSNLTPPERPAQMYQGYGYTYTPEGQAYVAAMGEYDRQVEREQAQPVTLDDCRKALRKVKKLLVTRNREEIYAHNLAKWLRPWDVVPELTNFTVPEGDFGVGIEIEMGFINQRAMQQAAERLINMKHVTLDWEGGTYPIEATFPPTLYSKFGMKSQAMRYSKWLRENANLLRQHEAGQMVGTHVNVSVGRRLDHNHAAARAYSGVPNACSHMSDEQLVRYFGRSPYGYAYDQSKFIEYKLFNSTADHEVLRKYVEVAVSLTRHFASRDENTVENIIAACERGVQIAEKKNRIAAARCSN